MNQLIRLTILFFACAALAVIVGAGPEPLSSGKEMKQVAPAPLPDCNWSGFYIGLNAGGQFGHSETSEPDTFNSPAKLKWGYSESGFAGGGQFGYNFQWHWLVIGPEFDLGYLRPDGHGREPPVGTLTDGETDGGFYTTLRGRAGGALNCWVFYATGGGIGGNYTIR